MKPIGVITLIDDKMIVDFFYKEWNLQIWKKISFGN